LLLIQQLGINIIELSRNKDLEKNEKFAKIKYLPKKQIGVETDPILFSKAVEVIQFFEK